MTKVETAEQQREGVDKFEYLEAINSAIESSAMELDACKALLNTVDYFNCDDCMFFMRKLLAIGRGTSTLLHAVSGAKMEYLASLRPLPKMDDIRPVLKDAKDPEDFTFTPKPFTPKAGRK
jgi:hypothetical protein